jgi:hypothetical protein
VGEPARRDGFQSQHDISVSFLVPLAISRGLFHTVIAAADNRRSLANPSPVLPPPSPARCQIKSSSHCHLRRPEEAAMKSRSTEDGKIRQRSAPSGDLVNETPRVDPHCVRSSIRSPSHHRQPSSWFSLEYGWWTAGTVSASWLHLGDLRCTFPTLCNPIAKYQSNTIPSHLLHFASPSCMCGLQRISLDEFALIPLLQDKHPNSKILCFM